MKVPIRRHLPINTLFVVFHKVYTGTVISIASKTFISLLISSTIYCKSKNKYLSLRIFSDLLKFKVLISSFLSLYKICAIISHFLKFLETCIIA